MGSSTEQLSSRGATASPVPSNGQGRAPSYGRTPSPSLLGSRPPSGESTARFHDQERGQSHRISSRSLAGNSSPSPESSARRPSSRHHQPLPHQGSSSGGQILPLSRRSQSPSRSGTNTANPVMGATIYSTASTASLATYGSYGVPSYDPAHAHGQREGSHSGVAMRSASHPPWYFNPQGGVYTDTQELPRQMPSRPNLPHAARVAPTRFPGRFPVPDYRSPPNYMYGPLDQFVAPPLSTGPAQFPLPPRRLDNHHYPAPRRTPTPPLASSASSLLRHPTQVPSPRPRTGSKPTTPLGGFRPLYSNSLNPPRGQTPSQSSAPRPWSSPQFGGSASASSSSGSRPQSRTGASPRPAQRTWSLAKSAPSRRQQNSRPPQLRVTTRLPKLTRKRRKKLPRVKPTLMTTRRKIKIRRKKRSENTVSWRICYLPSTSTFIFFGVTFSYSPMSDHQAFFFFFFFLSFPHFYSHVLLPLPQQSHIPPPPSLLFPVF